MNYENTAAGAARGLGGISDMLFRLGTQQKAEKKEALRDELARKKEAEDKKRAAEILKAQQENRQAMIKLADELEAKGMPRNQARLEAAWQFGDDFKNLATVAQYGEKPAEREHEITLQGNKDTAETNRQTDKLTAEAKEGAADRLVKKLVAEAELKSKEKIAAGNNAAMVEAAKIRGQDQNYFMTALSSFKNEKGEDAATVLQQRLLAWTKPLEEAKSALAEAEAIAEDSPTTANKNAVAAAQANVQKQTDALNNAMKNDKLLQMIRGFQLLQADSAATDTTGAQ
jgi:hypothetical protein